MIESDHVAQRVPSTARAVSAGSSSIPAITGLEPGADATARPSWAHGSSKSRPSDGTAKLAGLRCVSEGATSTIRILCCSASNDQGACPSASALWRYSGSVGMKAVLRRLLKCDHAFTVLSTWVERRRRTSRVIERKLNQPDGIRKSSALVCFCRASRKVGGTASDAQRIVSPVGSAKATNCPPSG